MAEINKTNEISAGKDERLPLKFNTQLKRLVCIEYPGYINDISKALKTLGGEGKVNATLNDPLRRIGMHFRPNDPYCRQSFGDRVPATDLLMKVKRKKRKKNGKEEVKYECEILGVIDTVVKFKGLADFQYLAPQIPDLLVGLRGSEILDIETPLHLPPPAFCRVDHPFDYQYRTDPVSKDRTLQTNEQRLGTTFRKPRPSHVISCHFQTPEVPTQPKEGAVKDMERYNNEGLDIVQRLFNIRPVWSRRAIVYHLGEKAKRIKYLLPCVAYYWIGGPWRTFWAKLGYDPRKNPAAKIYQKLDFRLRTKNALRGMKLPPTVRSIYEFPLTTRFQKGLNNSIVPLGVTNTNSSEKPGTSSEKPGTSSEKPGTSSEKPDPSSQKPGPSSQKPGPSSEDSVTEEGNIDMMVDTPGTPEILPYAFYPDQPPTTRQIIYQLCDIRCAEAQKLISANDGRERECNESEGWLEPGTSEKIRVVLTNTLIELNKKQKNTTETTGTIFGGDEQGGEMEDEEATFLDTLMDDDDVEAYDLLDDIDDF